MNFILSVISSVVGGYLLGISVLTKRWIAPFWRLGRARKFWGQFFRGRTIVVLTGRPGKHLRSTTKVSYCEVLGVLELVSFFKGLGLDVAIYNSQEIDSRQYLENNVIFVGKQNANKATLELSKKMLIPFSYDSQANTVYSEKPFITEPKDPKCPITEDYAFILKGDNPYDNGDKKVLVLAGNHGAATEGVIRYVTSKSGMDYIAGEVGKHDFSGIVKIPIEDNIPKKARPVKETFRRYGN
ncbi:MAG: hypothetical protein FVQ82_13950 [Planctomycetes bacterium]|nr:hypothetical protein [Planctomycetota bacterium]